MNEQTDADRIDYAVAIHRHHRKRFGLCLRCLRRYPCGVIRAFERGYVVGWDANPCNDLAELRSTFDLRWKADMRAIKMWQAKHPDKKSVWPDHADLVVWLMEQVDTLRG